MNEAEATIEVLSEIIVKLKAEKRKLLEALEQLRKEADASSNSAQPHRN